MSSVELLREAMPELLGRYRDFLNAGAKINEVQTRATFGRPPKCCVIYGGLRPPAIHMPARTENSSIKAAFGRPPKPVFLSGPSAARP